MNGRFTFLIGIWLLAVIGLFIGAHDLLWQFLRARGLGDHALGALFVWLPLSLLAAEWAAVVGIPVATVLILAKKNRRDETRGPNRWP
jgi:hypothetical protein